MILRPFKVVLLSALIFFIYIPGLPLIPSLVVPHNVTAVSFTLWGAIVTAGGWGFSSTTTTNPGPDIVVSPGASVTLSLFSADDTPTIIHQFCVDSEATPNFICEANEPKSPQFTSATTPTMFTFTATSTPGTYTYFCTIHTTSMQGKFIVQPVHDLAVSGVVASRNFAYQGIMSNPVQVNVTASNLGGQSETFWVAALANSTMIGNQTVTVASGKSLVVTFSFATSSLVRANYLVTGKVKTITGDPTPSDNTLVDSSTFTVRFKGDVNGDCVVDISDLAIVGGVFGRTQASSGFNPNADITNDGVVDIADLAIVGSNFGQHC